MLHDFLNEKREEGLALGQYSQRTEKVELDEWQQDVEKSYGLLGPPTHLLENVKAYLLE